MKRPNPCIKEDYVPLEDAIRHVLGIQPREMILAEQQARFRAILSRTIDPRDRGEWYFKVNNEDWPVRYEQYKSQYETITCVHLVDFKNWHEYYETQLARIRVLTELLRLESHAVEVFMQHGYDGVIDERGIFQSGNKQDKNKFLIFARKIESDENAAENDIVAARIALALPELWADYQSNSANPWVFFSRLLVYGSAIPDPQGKDRLLEEKYSEIEGMRPDAERGRAVVVGSKKGGLERSERFKKEKEVFLQFARQYQNKDRYKNRPRGWKTSLSIEVVEYMSRNSPFSEYESFRDIEKKADSARHWLTEL